MPLYEYRCQSCGRQIEALQKVDAPPLTTCKECGGELQRLISAPAFQFKGEGWYVTDYARKGKKDAGAKDAGEKSGGGGKEKGAEKGGAAKETKTGKGDGGGSSSKSKAAD
jgi:putative FmdB family regulatory protein